MILKNNVTTGSERSDLAELDSIRRWTAAAAICIGLTTLAVSAGLLLSVLPYFTGSAYADQDSRLGSILIALVFPLMILIAHCLDKIDSYDKKIRVARHEKRGFLDGPVRGALVIGPLLVLSAAANAQQTIFNVPSTDVLDRGGVYIELDAAFKPVRQNALGKFSSFVPRAVVGVGSNVEIGLNVTGNLQPGADTTTLVPTAKWRFYRNSKTKVDLIAGTNFYVPVRNRTYKFGTYSYLAGSKTVGKTRLSAGVFVAGKNVFAANAVRGGGQFGFEQTVNSNLTIAADWITGRHASGYFTPGLIYKPHPKVTTYWSYSIGNSDAAKGNHYFLFEVGYNF